MTVWHMACPSSVGRCFHDSWAFLKLTVLFSVEADGRAVGVVLHDLQVTGGLLCCTAYEGKKKAVCLK